MLAADRRERGYLLCLLGFMQPQGRHRVPAVPRKQPGTAARGRAEAFSHVGSCYFYGFPAADQAT